jgi:hypothetical protein
MNSRNITPSEYVGYYGLLYLYFSGLSLRRTAERIRHFVRRNHVSIGIGFKSMNCLRLFADYHNNELDIIK